MAEKKKRGAEISQSRVSQPGREDRRPLNIGEELARREGHRTHSWEGQLPVSIQPQVVQITVAPWLVALVIVLVLVVIAAIIIF